jgi:hypothetical protein
MERIPGRKCRLGVEVAVGQADVDEQGQVRRYRRRERRQVEIGKHQLDQSTSADGVEQLRVACDAGSVIDL